MARRIQGRLSTVARAKAGRRCMTVAARHPRLWRFLRAGVRRRFDAIAPRWDEIAGGLDSSHFAPVRGGLDRLPAAFRPAAAADIGTGTGAVALGLALRYGGARVWGFDLAPAMIAQADRNLQRHAEAQAVARRLRYAVADSAALPVRRASFDLAVASNTPLFFAELARLLRPGGYLVVAFSLGPRTPLYLPIAQVRAGLADHGFETLAYGAAGEGEFLLARRGG